MKDGWMLDTARPNVPSGTGGGTGCVLRVGGCPEGMPMAQVTGGKV